MAIIDNSTNVINSIPFTEQAVAPTTPPSGERRVFTKADGLYTVDSAGAVVGPFAAAAGAVYDPTGWVSAGETWTYASADAPTFTFTVAADVTAKYSVGMRIKLTQTTVKYFIITAVSAYSAPNTTITVYGGTDYTLANAAITANSYSVVKAPQGFPMSPAKWSVVVTNATETVQNSPTQNVWYNLGSITTSIPIGAWNVQYSVIAQAASGPQQTTLSTANNSQSDAELTTNMTGMNTAFAQKPVVVASKTSLYLNSRTTGSGISYIDFRGDVVQTTIRAMSAYL